MHLLPTSSAADRRFGGPLPRFMAAALAAGVLGSGFGVSAPAAHAAQPVRVKIKDHVLVVTGTAASDRIALRQSATDRQILEVDVGDNGSADVRVARERGP